MIKKLQSETSPLPAILSALMLIIFFGALITSYWTDLLSTAMRLVDSARAVGAENAESLFFVVRNSSNASPEQVRTLLNTLETQYRAISAYTKMSAPQKLPILIVNGTTPALLDGEQLVINFHDGKMESDLDPLYLVFMNEGLSLNVNAGLAAQTGHALQVVEAAGLGDGLIRQPLDAWVVLIRERKAYIPLDQAWAAPMPMDEQSGYTFFRAALEGGSFMKWFTAQYGLDTARQAAQGQNIAGLAGKPMRDLESAWLKYLDDKPAQPRKCSAVFPMENLFAILCRGLRQ